MPPCVSSNVGSNVISTGFQLASSVITSCGDYTSVSNVSLEPALFEINCLAKIEDFRVASSANLLLSDTKC